MRIGWLAIVLVLAAAPVTQGAPRRAWLIDTSAPQDAIDPAQRARIVEQLNVRIAALQPARKASMAVAPLVWPLQPADGFAPFGYTGTAYFVDHDPRFPGQVQDYTCGTRSYDMDSGYNHGGTDYYLWPFPWLMMDEGSVRIVAAAAGVIVEKHDGYFDRNCAIAGDRSAINAVYILQDDGLTAWYLHMRKGSVTTLPVGTRVAAGEYLGTVGSSGPSSLPHLHFELTDAADRVVDPRHGACNDAPERWIALQPYESARIDSLSTHSAEPEGVACGIDDGQPVHETPHAQDRFRAGETVWVFASYSDHRNGELSEFSLLRPDGSSFATWSFDLASEHLPNAFYSGTAWDWSHVLPVDAPPGVWKVRAVFAGRTYEHAFEVVPAVEADQRGLGGSWANPATDSQGVLLDLQAGVDTGFAFGGWFTYDTTSAGGRRWYTIQGAVQRGSVQSTLPIYRTLGGSFDAPLATTTAQVGTVVLQFTDCMHATMQYAFTDGSARSGTIPLSRLLENVSCTPDGDGAPVASNAALSGTFADPANSGQGLVLDFNPPQHVLFGAWYTFASNAGAGSGATGQRWYTLQATLPDGASITDIGLYESRNGVFDRAATTTTTQVGTASLVFHDCSAATLTYTFTSGDNAGRSGTLDLIRLGPPPDDCTM